MFVYCRSVKLCTQPLVSPSSKPPVVIKIPTYPSTQSKHVFEYLSMPSQKLPDCVLRIIGLACRDSAQLRDLRVDASSTYYYIARYEAVETLPVVLKPMSQPDFSITRTPQGPKMKQDSAKRASLDVVFEQMTLKQVIVECVMNLSGPTHIVKQQLRQLCCVALHRVTLFRDLSNGSVMLSKEIEFLP